MDPLPNPSGSRALSHSLLHSASAQELWALQRELLAYSPGMFAAGVSKGNWRMAPHLDLLDRTLVRAIEDARMGQLDGLVIAMPPQHGKSMLVSQYLPAWYLACHPDNRVILTAYEADFASQWGRKARDLLERYGGIFGVRVSRRSAAVHRWDIEGREGGMSTAGVGGPITGKGAHLLIVDDPLKNDEEAKSSSHRQKQWDWWLSTASTRLRPGGLMIVVQTRWHRDDLAGRILREAKTNGQRWRELKLPALAGENDPLGRQPGEALWPEVYDLEKLERLRSSRTPYFWHALYQQDPQAEGGTEWPEAYFGPSIWFDDWPEEWICRVMALDPSKGRDAKSGDYSAFVMLQVQPDGTLYVDANLDKRNVAVISATALELGKVFRPDGFAIEINQFQELLATEINRLGLERNVSLPIYGYNNHVPKIVRIRRLTPLLAQGLIKFKSGSASARLLVSQLRDFPHGDFDDGPDAAEMAVRMATDLLTAPPSDDDYTTEQVYI